MHSKKSLYLLHYANWDTYYSIVYKVICLQRHLGVGNGLVETKCDQLELNYWCTSAEIANDDTADGRFICKEFLFAKSLQIIICK